MSGPNKGGDREERTQEGEEERVDERRRGIKEEKRDGRHQRLPVSNQTNTGVRFSLGKSPDMVSWRLIALLSRRSGENSGWTVNRVGNLIKGPIF